MKREIVATEQAPAAVGPYSQGIQANEFVFTAGQLGIVPGTKEFAGEEIEAQTRQALENLSAVLKAGGSCLSHVVKTTVFLADMGEFARMNSIYAEFFTEDPPARSAVQAAALPLGGRFEIEAVAVVCDCEDDDCDCEC
ncbi:MAG: RidA family protein [Anaerolineae bacterium]|jgi:2-iminobutanoate/2-iminopropanoate deaminase